MLPFAAASGNDELMDLRDGGTFLGEWTYIAIGVA